MKRRRFGKSQLLGDLLQGQIRTAQVIDGDVPPQFVLECLKAGAFFAQVPAQGLRADMQVLGDGFQVWPGCAVAAQ